MERVLGSRPVNGFWSSGLQCRCSGFSKANQCQLMSPLRAHLGSSPAPLLAELQPFAWLSHHLRWEKNGLQLLMSPLVLLDSKHEALKPSLAARKSLAHGSLSCSPRKSVSHTLVSTPRALMDTSDGFWPCPKSGQCRATPVLPTAQVPGTGSAQRWAQLWHGLGCLKGIKPKTSNQSLNSSCLSKFALHSPATPPPREWWPGQRWKGACIKMKPRRWGIKSRSYGKNMCLWRLPLTSAHTFCSL